MNIRYRTPEIQPADAAPEASEAFDPLAMPILAAHWPDLAPVADAHVARLAQLELMLEEAPESRAA